MRKEINLKCTAYPNATQVKIKNRRISVKTVDNDEFIVSFVSLSSKEDLSKPLFFDESVKDKIRVAQFNISLEGAFALYTALGRELLKLK